MTEITRAYGAYRMKLTPYITLDENGEINNEKSYAQVSVSDLGNLKWPLMWSKPFPLAEAHAAMTLFEGIGYYPVMDV